MAFWKSRDRVKTVGISSYENSFTRDIPYNYTE